MTIIKKSLLGSLIFLFNGTLLATSCPQVGGYSLNSHNANNTRCVYRSNAVVQLGLQGAQVKRPICPRFILTDPHFRLVNCDHNLILRKCVCTIVSQ